MISSSQTNTIALRSAQEIYQIYNKIGKRYFDRERARALIA